MKLPEFKELQLTIESDSALIEKASRAFMKHVEKKYPKTDFITCQDSNEIAQEIHLDNEFREAKNFRKKLFGKNDP